MLSIFITNMRIAHENFLKTATGYVEAPKGMLEYKSIKSTEADLKDIDFKNKVVMCYWSAFNNKDFDDDIMVQGCYKKTIAENGPQGTNSIFYLKQHDWSLPLGKPTLLQEDSKGLYAEIPVTSGAGFAEDTLKLMAAGLMVQNSVGFVTKRSETIRPDENNWSTWYREIYEVHLREGSSVTLGANEDTPFEGFKSWSMPELDDLRKKINKTLRSGDMQDDTYKRLELALDQLQREYFILGTKDKSPEAKSPSLMSVECPNCKTMNEMDADIAVGSNDIECENCKCTYTKSYTIKSLAPTAPIGIYSAMSQIKFN